MKINSIEEVHAFIVHYKKLVDRKEYLDSVLKSEGITNIHWFEDIDRDTMTKEQLEMYQYDEKKWYELNSTWHQFEARPRKLTMPEIACSVTHVEIYKYIVENNIKIALFFEDDCLIYDNFRERLLKVINELPDDFDACYLSDCFGWTVDNYKFGYLGSLNKNKYSKNKLVYEMHCGKCADSFLLTTKCAKKLYENFVPFCLPPDWMQTPIYLKNNMKIYWSEPALTHQGSEDVYNSSIGRPGETPNNEITNESSNKTITNQTITNQTINQTINKRIPTKEDIINYSRIKGEKNSTKYLSLESEAKKRLEEFTDNIKNNKNFVIVKFGDGEMRNMISENENEHNCDGNNYFKNLGLELIESYIYYLKNDNCFINKWHSHEYNIQDRMETDYSSEISKNKFVYYDLLVHKIPFKQEQINFFRTIKESKRPKIYVSNIRMIQVLINVLNVDYAIEIPEVNSYNSKNDIVQNIINCLNDINKENCILMFSGGMFSKVLIAIIANKFPNNTYVDIGSTFDGLIKNSRDFNGLPGYREELIKNYIY